MLTAARTSIAVSSGSGAAVATTPEGGSPTTPSSSEDVSPSPDAAIDILSTDGTPNEMLGIPWDEPAKSPGNRTGCSLREGKLCSFSYVLFVFLLFYVLDVVSITVYDRDTLLNIGSSVAQRKPDFEFLNAGGLFTDTASEPFVWVAKSRRRRRRRKRGKRAGVLVRLRRRAFRPPLPTILLANVQSLDNKLCELRSRISYQRETRDCCVICLTETWMSAMVPDSAIELTGFSVHRSDRTKELTGKSRGGGVCFYINNSWCNERNIHSIKSFCSPDLEFHTLLCRPFWLPREFTAIIITAVYIPPQANTDQALRELYRNISEQETAHPDAAFVVTGDFNKANFNNIMKPIIKPTRPLLLPLPGRIQVPPPPTFRQIGSLFRSAPACL